MTQYRSTLILPPALVSPGEKNKVSIDFTLTGARKWAKSICDALTEEEKKAGAYVKIVMTKEEHVEDIRP